MKYSEKYFNAIDNKKLFARFWEADNPKLNIVIIHGHGEHSGRYKQFAKDLTEESVSCFAFDLRGHGKSFGKRGYIADFKQFYSDISEFVELILGIEGNLPLYIFGHSLGGLLVFRYVQTKDPQNIKGVILSSPLFGLAIKIPKLKLKMLPVMKTILPKLTLYNEVDPSQLSHDAEVVNAYIKDPLVHNRASAPMFYGLLEEMGKSLQKASSWHHPLLVQFGDEDRIVDITAVEKLCSVIRQQWLTKIKYKGFFHEVYNELERNKPLEDLKKWILSQNTNVKSQI